MLWRSLSIVIQDEENVSDSWFVYSGVFCYFKRLFSIKHSESMRTQLCHTKTYSHTIFFKVVHLPPLWRPLCWIIFPRSKYVYFSDIQGHGSHCDWVRIHVHETLPGLVSSAIAWPMILSNYSTLAIIDRGNTIKYKWNRRMKLLIHCIVTFIPSKTYTNVLARIRTYVRYTKPQICKWLTIKDLIILGRSPSVVRAVTRHYTRTKYTIQLF